MNSNLSFWENVSLIKKVLLVNTEIMAKLFDLDEPSFSILKAQNKTPPVANVNEFLNRLNISFDSLFEGNFDLFKVREAFLGNEKALPGKYSFGAFSSSRTIINCLRYVEYRFGYSFLVTLLRCLQVDARFFEKDDRWLNIRFAKDLFRLLREIGFRDVDFHLMGQESFEANKNSSLGKRLSESKNLKSMLEEVCQEHSKKFDKNFDYFITKIEKNSIYVGSRPKEDVVDIFKDKTLMTPEICLTKQGVFSSFSRYIGEETRVFKTKCLTQGDNYFEYKINHLK